MNDNYTLFEIRPEFLKTLTADEEKILPILIEAAKKVDAIYHLQKNDKFPGGNLYPHNATKEEIEHAAKSNPMILDYYSVVERDNSGSLTTIPYHQKFASHLKEITQIIKKAAEISKNLSFKNYLNILCESLLKGTYEKLDIAWLSVEGSNLDFTLSPYESDIDKLFGFKRAYQSHVGIINKPKSQQAKNIKDVLFLNPGPRTHHMTNKNVQVQVQEVVIFSGLLGESLYSREHLPTNYETREKYGSKIIGYLTTIDLKFEKLILPIFNSLFEKKFRDRYSVELLKKGNYYHALFYGLARQIHKYPGAQERLKDLFQVFDQANNLVSGIQHTKHLILKGVIDQKELEAAMITQICWMFSEWIVNREVKVREPILKGDALILKFLIDSGALQEQDGVSWPNFAKMFFEIENLSSVFNRFMEEVPYLEAKEFLDKHLTLDTFSKFDNRLAQIKTL